jgi:hypothetical protein
LHGRPIVVYAPLIFVVIASLIPAAKAQTTSILNVEYPKSAIFNIGTQTASPPLTVSATIAFTGAKPGYFLQVALYTLGSGELTGGSAAALPDGCLRGDSGSALCLIQLTAGQGEEDVQFTLVRPQLIWDLAIVTGLRNQTLNLIYDSISDYEFTIRVATALTLKVLVPENVTLTVDGIPQTPGNISISLITGSHNLSIPSIVSVNNSTRLKFSSWSDGELEMNRTVLLNQDVTLQAEYTTQYRLQVVSPQVNSTGADWYDQNTTAQFSTQPSPQPITSWLGIFGGEWRFHGWYENQTLLTPSQNGTLRMNAPHLISAQWEADYSIPATIVVGAAIIALAATRKHWRRSEAQRNKSVTARR